MKRGLLCCICLLLAFSFVIAASADTQSLFTINSLLRSNQTNKKTEVSDNLDEFYPLNEQFADINYDFRILILQREAPQKEFTAKKTYPPFKDTDGFDENFTGVDIGSSRLWLRSDLMAQLPSYFCASSLEDATYLLVAENIYEWDGTICVSDYKDSGEKNLPDFRSANEMMLYFIEHPRIVDSVTYYPKFGVYSMITLYETKTKKSSLVDYTYTASKRFARNPDASIYWDNMTYVADLLDAVDEESGVDVTTAKRLIESLNFIPQGKKDLWISCIEAEEYSTAHHSITEYYWSMAMELRELDASQDNKENYNLIIRDRNKSALSLFVNYCDYSGFDRSVSSIETSKDYIASPDYDWMEKKLKEIVLMFNP